MYMDITQMLRHTITPALLGPVSTKCVYFLHKSCEVQHWQCSASLRQKKLFFALSGHFQLKIVRLLELVSVTSLSPDNQNQEGGRSTDIHTVGFLVQFIDLSFPRYINSQVESCYWCQDVILSIISAKANFQRVLEFTSGGHGPLNIP